MIRVGQKRATSSEPGAPWIKVLDAGGGRVACRTGSYETLYVTRENSEEKDPAFYMASEIERLYPHVVSLTSAEVHALYEATLLKISGIPMTGGLADMCMNALTVARGER